MDLNRFRKVPDREVNIPNVDDIASSEVYYFDEEGNYTDKEHSVRTIIKAYDKDGKLINETYGQRDNVSKL